MTNEPETNVEETGKDGAAQGMAPAERIRDLNDELRKTGFGGETFVTRGLLSKEFGLYRESLRGRESVRRVQRGQRPVAGARLCDARRDGETVIFKIDYYDLNREYGSDPADPM